MVNKAAKYFSIILFITLLAVIVSACTSASAPADNVKQPVETSGKVRESADIRQSNYIEVKGILLKVVLIDTLYEMYQINISKQNEFSRETYAGMGSDCEKHYDWLTGTYNQFSKENKENLKTMFESGLHAWWLMDQAVRLDDSANVEDIANTLADNGKIRQNSRLVNAIEDLIPAFYADFFSKYFDENKNLFDKMAKDMNSQIEAENPDITGFMEQISGIHFSQKYKPLFYYTLRPIGAMGFANDNLKISTIQRTCIDFHSLLGTPFHEYSHELFRTFTQSADFKKVSEALKQNKSLYNTWVGGMNQNYDWNGWCEENLVEGFSNYLNYKYYQRENYSRTYILDHGFYIYLKARDFDGQKDSLEKVCIEYLQEHLE